MNCSVTQEVFVVENYIRNKSYQKRCIKIGSRFPCVKIPLKLQEQISNVFLVREEARANMTWHFTRNVRYIGACLETSPFKYLRQSSQELGALKCFVQSYIIFWFKAIEVYIFLNLQEAEYVARLWAFLTGSVEQRVEVKSIKS